MAAGLAALAQPVGAYPERRPDVDGRHGLRADVRLRDRLRPRQLAMRGETAALLQAVARAGASSAPAELARSLRRAETRWAGTIGCFALVRQAVERELGFRPHDEQLAGAWHMLTGKLVEMETGEGKTVTAVFTAAAHALAGRSVHVVTVNDYLAERDAGAMGPVYRALGLSVGCVTGGMDEDARRDAYGASVVYVTPKQLMFDYLRDRLSLGSRAGSRLRTDIAVLRARRGPAGGTFYLRGLQAAVVDEADSVLVDEAVVPLIISRQDVSPDQGRIAADAIAIAGRLEEGRHFGVAAVRRDLWLTEAGRAYLADLARPLGGVLGGKLWREQYAEQALTALHLFRRDRDYIIRDGAVEIVDIATGRTMPDRSWERGLHQMIQVKEGLAITAPNESITRITHQAFFQRYLNLCGMSGTVREVSGEIRRVYGLRTILIPRHHPARRRAGGVTVLTRGGDPKAALVAARAARAVAAGRSVLIGTRTITDSEAMSAGLAAAGLPHRVLNAHRDGEEAPIIAAAGEVGAVTVATNMAGRGTDIRLDPAVRYAGGLHVIATERHESRRIDRQLFGRSARQDDPGSYEEIVALDDEVLVRHCPAFLLALARWPLGLKRLALVVGQRRAGRRGRELRLRFARYEVGMDQALSFAGRDGREPWSAS